MSTTRTQGISLITATAVVVANMIGTGVFTSLGFQVGSLPSGFVLMMLWGNAHMTVVEVKLEVLARGGPVVLGPGRLVEGEEVGVGGGFGVDDPARAALGRLDVGEVEGEARVGAKLEAVEGGLGGAWWWRW